tara:strand:- start:3155 stop:5089 length:1935 start_codon:yes stop_codon:yes gene_type:complete
VGFLNPVLLFAGAAVLVPLALHLFHRNEAHRVSFPALRYLLRTEREHARRIRLRQLLLLMMRVGVTLLLVLVAARPFLRNAGDTHPPTALAIVLDNSLSVGRVVGDERLLDGLKRRALDALDAASPDDRIWVLRAGEPWDVPTPGRPSDARYRVATTEISSAAGNLADVVRRASALVGQAGLPAAEIQVLTDLQATAFPDTGGAPIPVPVLVFHPSDTPPPNRYLGNLVIGGGLPPVAGRRTELTARVGGNTDEAPLRLIIDDRIRGATRVPPGATAAIPFGPFQAGWTSGYVETDPDELGGDDHRWFVQAVREPPVVSLQGASPFFLDQALAVLEDGGRLQRSASQPNVVLAVAGEGAMVARTGSTVVVVPPIDAGLLPALNRRLAAAGIPWRYEKLPGRGEVRVGEYRIPVPLDDVRVSTWYRLVGSGSNGGAEVVARLEDGSPWIVRGRTGAGTYRLVGSALDPDVTNLPLSAFMVPLLEWLISTSEAGAGGRAVEAGRPLSLPTDATAVETPDGSRHPVDPALDFRPTRESGIYRVMRGDSVLDAVAVNPPMRESLLEPAEGAVVVQTFGPGVRIFTDTIAWTAAVFSSRQGDELWRPVLAITLLLLVLESVVAASGATQASPSWKQRTGDAPTPPLSAS